MFAAYASSLVSRLVYSLVTPLWYIISTIVVGIGFEAGAASVTNLGFIYIFFRNSSLKWALILYGAVLTMGVFIYVDVYGCLYPDSGMPYDSVTTFLISSFWLILTFEIYRKENELLIDELQKKNVQLNATTEELEQFTYIASHDLKTPLRNVISFLGIIERKAERGEYDDLLEDLQYAKKGSKQMYSLVTDILEMTKVNNDLNSGRKSIELSTVIDKVSYELKNQYPTAHIENKVTLYYLVNESHFYILFQNLISNGLKYNESDEKHISIWNAQKDTSVQIFIKDNGIGIDEQFHNQIFDFFKRLHNSQKYDGTGLGLGLCKKIIESYSGSISVSASSEEGTTFLIELPLS